MLKSIRENQAHQQLLAKLDAFVPEPDADVSSASGSDMAHHATKTNARRNSDSSTSASSDVLL